MISTNLDLLLASFNQFVFNQAKSSIKELQYYYSTNPDTAGNPLIKDLLDSIEKYNLENIDIPLVQSILAKDGKNAIEQKEIIGKFIEYKQYDKEKIEPVKTFLRNVVASAIIRSANTKFNDSPSDFVKYIKNVDFKGDDGVDYLNPIGFKDIDINSIVTENSNDYIKSKFDFINQLSPCGGIYRGEFIVIGGSSGVGKSMLCMEEALYIASSGYNVVYFCLGDLCMRDFVVRMGAQQTGQPFKVVSDNLGQAYKQVCNAVGDHFDLCIAPAATISAENIVDYVKNSQKKIDVVFVDYDLNVKHENSDSMYLDLGYLYDKLTELTLDPRYNVILYVASQLKVSSWADVDADMSSLSDSSRKQHIASQIWIRTKDPNSPNGLGKLKVVKNRRGESDVSAHVIRLANGRTRTLPEPVYNDILQIPDKRVFLDPEIDMMIQNYQQSRMAVNNTINQKMNNAPGFKNNPFVRHG